MAIVLLVLFVLMWILLIVPRQRELRRHKALVASLVVGDEVMTTSGIYGTLRRIEADHVALEVAPGLELKVARQAVAARVAPDAPDAPEGAGAGAAAEAAPAEGPVPDDEGGEASGR